MSRVAKLTVLCSSFLILSYVALGYVLGKTTDDRAYRALAVFGEVLQHIQQDYVEDANLPLVTSGALHGLLESLDPQSSYLSPQAYAEYRKKTQNGAKGETGAVLSKRFGYIVVVTVLPDSPAEKAGVRNGDIMEAIAGFTTREMSIGQAQILLAGDPGTTVKVSVVRRPRMELHELELTRSRLAVPPILTDRIEGDIAYLRIPTLNAGKAEEIRQKLLEAERQGARKLILDLRDCAQGETAEGIATARLFLTSGTIATLRGQTTPHQEFAAEPAKVVWKHPVTVLISGGTSGAAEVLAAALADNQRGDTVGERTFGTASEQKLIPLDDGAALVLTVANYYTPGGKSIPDAGVAPTVPVSARDDLAELDDDLPLKQEPSREDQALKKAIELLLAPSPATQQGETRKAA